MMVIKETLYGVCFSVSKIAILAWSFSCLDWWQYATQTGHSGHKGKTDEICQDKVGQCFKILASEKRLPDIIGI